MGAARARRRVIRQHHHAPLAAPCRAGRRAAGPRRPRRAARWPRPSSARRRGGRPRRAPPRAAGGSRVPRGRAGRARPCRGSWCRTAPVAPGTSTTCSPAIDAEAAHQIGSRDHRALDTEALPERRQRAPRRPAPTARSRSARPRRAPGAPPHTGCCAQRSSRAAIHQAAQRDRRPDPPAAPRRSACSRDRGAASCACACSPPRQTSRWRYPTPGDAARCRRRRARARDRRRARASSGGQAAAREVAMISTPAVAPHRASPG